MVRLHQSTRKRILGDSVTSVLFSLQLMHLLHMQSTQDKLVFLYSEHACFTPFL